MLESLCSGWSMLPRKGPSAAAGAEPLARDAPRRDEAMELGAWDSAPETISRSNQIAKKQNCNM